MQVLLRNVHVGRFTLCYMYDSGWCEGGLLLCSVPAKPANMQCCRRLVSRTIDSAEEAVTATKFASSADFSVCVHSTCNCTTRAHCCCRRQQWTSAACRRNRNWKNVGSAVPGRADV